MNVMTLPLGDGRDLCAKPADFAPCAVAAGLVRSRRSHWPRSRVGLRRPRRFPAARRIRQRTTDYARHLYFFTNTTLLHRIIKDICVEDCGATNLWFLMGCAE